MTITLTEAKALLWRAQEDVRHTPLEPIADDLLDVWQTLTIARDITRRDLESLADLKMPLGHRGRVKIVLLAGTQIGRARVRALAFARAVLLAVDPTERAIDVDGDVG